MCGVWCVGKGRREGAGREGERKREREREGVEGRQKERERLSDYPMLCTHI